MKKPPEFSEPPFSSPGRFGALRHFFSRDGREHAWAFLDYLDARPALKKTLIIGIPALAIAVGLGAWGYGRWERDNAVRITRQWLAAGRLDRAANAVQNALAAEPDDPAPWRLASELAWKKGNRAVAVDYAKKAAEVGHYGDDDVLAWAEAALLSDDVEQAREAAAYLSPGVAKTSPRALRLSGELARRGRRFAEARDRFEDALQIDAQEAGGPVARDEIPLGIVCLQAGSPADRRRGQVLLAKWTTDESWGVEALRALIADAMDRGDRGAAGRWAEALRAHPRCTLGDVPAYLRALFFADRARYEAALAALENGRNAKPVAAAELIGWLVQIGRGEDAIDWIASLDPAIRRKPPVAPGLAEALRATRRWSDLQAVVDRADWGPQLNFLKWAYGMTAARKLGDDAVAESLWQSLYGDGRRNGAHALFAGESLYAWGYPKEAADLLWLAADRADLAYQALGSLARLYQVGRDAGGQLRVFKQLNAMRPGDRQIANNYIYFAALTDLGNQRYLGQLAEDLFNREPGNPTYRCTYAFVLVWSGESARAMRLLSPVAAGWRTSPAVAFAYGAALAGVGRKTEARDVFASLDPQSLDPKEADWIQAALR